MSPIATLPSWQLRQNFDGPCQFSPIVGYGVPPAEASLVHLWVFRDSV
jgi:hypothetical protein